MDKSEKLMMNPEQVFFAHEMEQDDYWMDNAIDLMTDNVYISLDLDVFDPSILPSTGTPEPGGLWWQDVLYFLKRVIQERNVVGFDIVELCPNPYDKSSDFLVAKLYYKMLSYRFQPKTISEEEIIATEEETVTFKKNKFNDEYDD